MKTQDGQWAKPHLLDQCQCLLLTPVNRQANDKAPIDIDGNDVLQ